MALTASLLAAATTDPAPSVAADHHTHLHQRKHQVQHSISASKSNVDQVSQQLLRTKSRLVSARDGLRGARVDLAGVRAQVADAISTDQRMQARLDGAIARLQAARDDLQGGRHEVAASRAALASYAVSNYQSGGSLGLGIAFESQSPQQALNNLQATATVLDKQSTALQRFQATKVLLKLTASRVHANQVTVARQRDLAAQHLQTERSLEAQAQLAEQAVAGRVADLRVARQHMAAAKQTELHRLDVLRNEQNRIDSRLKTIAARRARRHARQLAQQHAAAKTGSATSAHTGYLSYPVHNTYVTSPYGMRMHPILHILELHDGTDLHATCGTPVYAAASGKVLTEDYNVGYGNRLLLDNGFVRGVSLSTSYNHLSRYVATVGERVRRGQLIAYSGDTGWSTACHLHFMVYVNGATVDPMTWL
jgi:murein DD-endopeptidase MepM/ murein hydrolase activator NlpD